MELKIYYFLKALIPSYNIIMFHTKKIKYYKKTSTEIVSNSDQEYVHNAVFCDI